jgi:inward rectifier potassium channel
MRLLAYESRPSIAPVQVRKIYAKIYAKIDAMTTTKKPRATRTQVVRFGDREVIAEGVQQKFLADLSHRCMTASWPAFIAGAVLIFLVFNAIFASLYWIGNHPIANVPDNSYIDYLYFSIETLSTAGYGDMHPQTHYGHFIAAVELFTGIFSMSLMTGLIFARFSRPKPRFLFAERPVISNHDGTPTLMIRFANERHNAITHAAARLWAITTETSSEGQLFRRFSELQLARSDSPILALTWTIFHTINEKSVLHGFAAQQFEAGDINFVLLVSGFDENAAQDIHARKTYRHADILHGHRYADIVSVDEDGRTRVDYRRFHETRPDQPGVPAVQ